MSENNYYVSINPGLPFAFASAVIGTLGFAGLKTSVDMRNQLSDNDSSIKKYAVSAFCVVSKGMAVASTLLGYCAVQSFAMLAACELTAGPLGNKDSEAFLTAAAVSGLTLGSILFKTPNLQSPRLYELYELRDNRVTQTLMKIVNL